MAWLPREVGESQSLEVPKRPPAMALGDAVWG